MLTRKIQLRLVSVKLSIANSGLHALEVNSWKKNKSEAGLGIRSFADRSFAHSLSSLKSNERLWAIRSKQFGKKI